MRIIATLAEMLVTIGADTSGLESSLAQTGDKVKSFGEGMKGVGEGMTKAITLPLAGLGAAALTVAAQHDDIQGRIQAQMGTTASEAEKLADTATNLWRNAFGEDINEAADAVTTVGQNMQGLPVDQIESAAEKAFILKDAFGTEIVDSTKAANTMMENFGISADEAFDLMTVGFQKGGDYSGELIDTLNEYAPAFSGMGHSAEDMMNILIAGAEAGSFSLDKVGDAMKEFNIRAKDGSDGTAEAFQAIGLNADEMGAAIAQGGEKGEQAFQATLAAIAAIKDPQEQAAAGVALFGTQWEDLESDVIKAMGTTTDKLGEVEGATQTAGDAMYDNFGTRLTEVWRGAQEALLPLGEILLEMAETWLPKIAAAVETVATWFQNLSPTMQTIVVVLGLVAAAIGPVLVVVGTLISLFAALAPVAAVLGVSVGALIGIIAGVIAAIVALVVAGVLIWKNWDTIKAKTIEIWGAIKEWLAATWESIKAVAASVWGSIKSFFASFWEGTKSLFSAAVAAVKLAVVNKWNEIKSTTTAVWNGIKSFFSSLWSGIKSLFTSAVNGVKSFVTNAWNNIKSTTSSVFNSVKSFLTSVWNGIKSTIQNTVSAIKEAVRSKFNALKEAVSSAMQATKDRIKSIWDSVMSFFKGIDLASIGRNIIQGLINGISGAAKGLYNKAKEIASNVVGKFKGIFDINSPSRVFKWMGEMNGKGLEQGMQNSLVRIKKVASQMAKAAIPPTQKFKGDSPLAKYFNAILEDGDWMNDWATHLPKSMQGMLLDVGKQFSNMTTNDLEREEMSRTKTTIQIPVQLNGNEIAYATVDDMEGLLAQRMYSQDRKGGFK